MWIIFLFLFTPKMNAKINKNDIKSTAIKKKCRVISLEDKLHMINKYEAGITKPKIARECGLNESTFRHILHHKIYLIN
jgi:predicted transcriptional regulator